MGISGVKRKIKTNCMMQYVRVCLQSNVPCECFNMELNFNIEIEWKLMHFSDDVNPTINTKKYCYVYANNVYFITSSLSIHK